MTESSGFVFVDHNPKFVVVWLDAPNFEPVIVSLAQLDSPDWFGRKGQTPKEAKEANTPWSRSTVRHRLDIMNIGDSTNALPHENLQLMRVGDDFTPSVALGNS